MILSEVFEYSEKFLLNYNIDEPEFKALCIACHLAGIRNSQYKLHSKDDVNVDDLEKMLERIKSGEPLQYVIGKWDFYDSEFYVGDGVLIPRPETEELTHLAVTYIQSLGKCKVYDLCAGTGCIGLSIAKACPACFVTLIEKSTLAFHYLKKNVQKLSNVKIILGDISDTNGYDKADVIISNPPYIKTSEIPTLQSEVLREPAMALDGGTDGLDFYRIINDKWSSLLCDEGRLFLEIGNEQGSDIVSVLTNFRDINILKDIYGNDRMVVAVRRDIDE